MATFKEAQFARKAQGSVETLMTSLRSAMPFNAECNQQREELIAKTVLEIQRQDDEDEANGILSGRQIWIAEQERKRQEEEVKKFGTSLETGEEKNSKKQKT